MKILILIAAMLLNFSFAIQNAMQGIQYPNPGIQLPVVKVYASANTNSYQDAINIKSDTLALN